MDIRGRSAQSVFHFIPNLYAINLWLDHVSVPWYSADISRQRVVVLRLDPNGNLKKCIVFDKAVWVHNC